MDNVFYQQKIKRSNSLLKLLVFVLIVILIASSGIGDIKRMPSINKGREYVGYVNINSVINDETLDLDKLDRLRDDDNLKALIVKINTPGGSVVATQRIYKALKALRDKGVPVAATMGDLAASGGYMSAIGADKIYAHEGTITGSIGVIAQSPEVTELADKLGVKFNVLKSGEHKADLNPVQQLKQEDRNIIMEMINSSHKYFLEIVSKNRDLSHETVNKVSDGRVVSGIQALELNLVDEIGGFVEAKNWLKEEKQIETASHPQEIVLTPEESVIKRFMKQSVKELYRGGLYNQFGFKLSY